jgi:thymidylate kinase
LDKALKIIYLIGSPGAGKTTLSHAFMKNWEAIGDLQDPIKHRLFNTAHGKAISLGWNREHFGGTDTLGNTAIIPIEDWLPKIAQGDLWAVFGEGDRLANVRFFTLAQRVGDLQLFYLDTDPEEAAGRRLERAERTGKLQNPTWVKGRETKHRNLALSWKAYRLDGNLTPEQNAALMWDVVLS